MPKPEFQVSGERHPLLNASFSQGRSPAPASNVPDRRCTSSRPACWLQRWGSQVVDAGGNGVAMYEDGAVVTEHDHWKREGVLRFGGLGWRKILRA